MEKQRREELIARALEARERAYAPYSHYAVGAALLTAEGEIYQGCNVENASYGVSCCAERTAFFKAVSEGVRQFRAICVVGGPGERLDAYTPPCGVCRQVMMEFCQPEEFEIILATGIKDYKVYTLKELLPQGFGPGNLSKESEENGPGNIEIC